MENTVLYNTKQLHNLSFYGIIMLVLNDKISSMKGHNNG